VIVVIDTNVWISALQFAKLRGTPTLALEKAMRQDVIATCDEVDAEIVRVLTKSSPGSNTKRHRRCKRFWRVASV
jgi:predicted nucleic acid-binding protein